MMDRITFGKNFMEFLGTFILVMTIQLSVGVTSLSEGLASQIAPVAIGVVLITVVYAGGPISGAQYNPQIGLAVFLRGKQSMTQMLSYWVFQIVGGYLGALYGGVVGGNFITFARGADYSIAEAFFAEVLFSFLLSFVVLGSATNSKAADNHYYGAAIGLVVMAGAVSVGSISGGAFNPAVALGLGLSNSAAIAGNIGYVIIVVAADLVGGALAALGFYVVAPDEFDSWGASADETAKLVE